MEAGRSVDVEGQGIIRIQSQSPYEHLDVESAKWLNHLKQMWPLWRKCKATTQMLYDFFSKSQNPFVSSLQIMITCGDFYSGKPNSLAFNIMDNFSTWLEDKKPRISYLLTRNLKYDAFNLVIKQKNQSLINLVATTYKMAEDKEIFLDSIKCLFKSSRYKEACQCAIMLKLHMHFKLEDFLIPLVFQDKYAVAEKFLKDSRQHQIELAMFLDNLLGKKNIRAEAETIIKNYQINDAKLSRLHYKPLSKLVARIVKTFNLQPSVCPNLTAKRGKGALQFLLHKRYVEKTISGESWAEMAVEAVGDDTNLQAKLVEGVAFYGDLKEALNWAERFGIPEESWPFKLREFSGRENDESTQSADEMADGNWDEPRAQSTALKFHQLPIHESQIILIDTASAFSNFLDEISQGIAIVGIDAEWKPSFGFKTCDLALIQVATFYKVYILDVITLGSAAPKNLWERFANILLGNPEILKLGFGLNTDLVIVRQTLRKIHGIKTADLGFLDLALLWKVLVHDYDFVFPYSSVSCSRSSESLNSLIELCLGEKLDKSDQFSNWENRPLRKSQLLYAALDAYCLLEAYNVIVKESESQNIPISDVLSEITDAVALKKVKKPKGEQSPMEPENGTSRSHAGKKKSVSEFRVLCDAMLAGLGKQLRKCGVDTIILETGQEPSVKETAGKVTLSVVTQRRNFNRFKKYGHVYCVQSKNLREQVLEVLQYFNVDVKEGDVYSRCMVCNSNEFQTMTQEDMKRMVNCSNVPTTVPPPEEVDYSLEFFDDDYGVKEDWTSTSQKWSSSQEPLDHLPNRTRTGALIRIEAVPIPVLNRIPIFYVCVHCGKCFWDGSHKERGLGGFMGQVIKR